MSKVGFLKNKVFSNSLWLILEKILSIFGLIFVTSMVAKYIGPNNYGKLVFASSLFAVIQTISMFGSENLFFQKISKSKKLGEILILATKQYRTYIYFILSSILLAYLYVSTDHLTFIYSVATCIALYFTLHDMPYVIYFDALLKSKINVICNMSGVLLTLLFRYILVVFKLDIFWLIIPILSFSIIPYMIRLYFYRKIRTKEYKKTINLIKYKKYMIGAGKKLILYSLAIMIYTKTAQIFLGMKSQFDLGIYTVAITIGTSFAFVLNAIITSYTTQIYAEKSLDQSQKMVSLLYAIIIVVSFFAIIFLYIFGHYMIEFLYGNNYKKVNDILFMVSISCLLSSIANISDKYLIKLNAYKYLSTKNNILMVINIVMSIYLIHSYGLKGAVISLFMTELISATFSNYFIGRGVILKIQLSTFFPSTYIKYFR